MDSILLECPACGLETPLPPDELQMIKCAYCGHSLDARAQLCYLRACDVFAAMQSIIQQRPGKTRRVVVNDDQMLSIEQGYTALQEALQGDLTDRQCCHAVEMMADMARLLADRVMTSRQEAKYWAVRVLYQNARSAYVELQQRLAEPAPSGLRAKLQRVQWRLHSNRLARNMPRIQHELEVLECAIGFAYPLNIPHSPS